MRPGTIFKWDIQYIFLRVLQLCFRSCFYSDNSPACCNPAMTSTLLLRRLCVSSVAALTADITHNVNEAASKQRTMQSHRDRRWALILVMKGARLIAQWWDTFLGCFFFRTHNLKHLKLRQSRALRGNKGTLAAVVFPSCARHS